MGCVLEYPTLEGDLTEAITAAAEVQKVAFGVIATDVLGVFDVGRFADLDEASEMAARRFVTLLATRSLLIGPVLPPGVEAASSAPAARAAPAKCATCNHSEAKHFTDPDAPEDEPKAGCHLCNCHGFAVENEA